MFVANIPAFKRAFLLLLFLATAPLYARVIPASDYSASIPDVTVLEDGVHAVQLRTLLAAAGTGPVVVLPIFTNCAASCPLQTRKLKQAIANLHSSGGLRIVVFSFDPSDTESTIEQYRKREGVPESWKVVTAREDDIRNFFQFFQYSVMDDKGQFIHPDQIFLLDPDLQWRFTITGLIWSPQELGQAIEETRSPGIHAWMVSHPDALGWTGFLGVLLGLGLLGAWFIYFRPAQRSVAS